MCSLLIKEINVVLRLEIISVKLININRTQNIARELDNANLSRNKIMKINTQPSLATYNSKVVSTNKDPAKSFIKKYLNPSQKFYASKEWSKSFVDTSSSNGGVVK